MKTILTHNSTAIINRTSSALDGRLVRIKGIASHHPENIFYIVQNIDGLTPLDGSYTCIVLTDACLDPQH